MCAQCWTAAQTAPVAAVAGRFAWLAHRERIKRTWRSLRRSHPEVDPAR